MTYEYNTLSVEVGFVLLQMCLQSDIYVFLFRSYLYVAY